MPQMYSRVFLQILDSSLADDWQTRHVFEDLLKLCNMDGVVDMTRQAITRRTNVPLDVVTHAIDQLESADKNSRDVENEGRRIIRLDEHRDWGWRILNWPKYESIRVQNDMRAFNAARMRNYRAKRPPQTPPDNQPQPHPQPHPQGVAHTEPTCSTTPSKRFVPPTEEEAKLHAAKMGLPECEVTKFLAYYQSNGWRVGKNPMRCWRAALVNWRSHWEENGRKAPAQAQGGFRFGQPKDGW